MQNTILTACGSIERCFDLPTDGAFFASGVLHSQRKRVESFLVQRHDPVLRDKTARILYESRTKGIDVIVREDSRFPNWFAGIYDMPVVLYGKGQMNINLYRTSAGIVGAKRCSQQEKENAISVAKKAVKKQGAVISGMAKGVDAYARIAAIRNNGYTIAVLGCGADICYPAEHEKLYENIQTNGCILSEYPPGIKPNRYTFPLRNRLIAALSDIVYFVDTGRNSGTTTTKEYCRKYGRAIICI